MGFIVSLTLTLTFSHRYAALAAVRRPDIPRVPPNRARVRGPGTHRTEAHCRPTTYARTHSADRHTTGGCPPCRPSPIMPGAVTTTIHDSTLHAETHRTQERTHVLARLANASPSPRPTSHSKRLPRFHSCHAASRVARSSADGSSSQRRRCANFSSVSSPLRWRASALPRSVSVISAPRR